MKKEIKKPLNNLSWDGLQINTVVRGLIWALVITIILGILFSLLLQYTTLSEGMLSSYSTFIFFISMLLGSIIGARAAGSKGLLHGLVISLCYWGLTLAIGVIWNPGTISLVFLMKRLGFTAAAGILGGVIGIGLSSGK